VQTQQDYQLAKTFYVTDNFTQQFIKMLNTIIQLLKSNDFYGQSEIIDIAKGKYKLTTSVRESYKQAKRELYLKQAERWQRKK
jgi:hypothetical protein